MELADDGDSNFSWCAWNGLQSLWKGTGRIETIQTTVLSRSDRILGRFLETFADLLLSNFSERPSADACVKNLQAVKYVIIIIDRDVLFLLVFHTIK